MTGPGFESRSDPLFALYYIPIASVLREVEMIVVLVMFESFFMVEVFCGGSVGKGIHVGKERAARKVLM